MKTKYSTTARQVLNDAHNAYLEGRYIDAIDCYQKIIKSKSIDYEDNVTDSIIKAHLGYSCSCVQYFLSKKTLVIMNLVT